MFYLMGIFRTSSLGDSFSSDPERSVLRRQGELSGYIEICSKGQIVLTSKNYYQLRKTTYLKLRSLELFSVWENARVWAY